MAVIWCPLVGGDEVQDGRDVRAGIYGNPVNLFADGLVGGLVFGYVGVFRSVSVWS